MKTVKDIPTATFSDVFEILAANGVSPWRRIKEPQSRQAFLMQASLSDINLVLGHSSKEEVIVFQNPKYSNPYIGVRRLGKNSVTVFVSLPEKHVIVVGEFRHGVEQVMLSLPGGGCKTNEKPEQAAIRECEEETGLVLQELIPLSTSGIPVNSRASKGLVFPFLSFAENSCPLAPTKLDSTEIIGAVVMSESEWLKAIRAGRVDAVSASASLLAMRDLTWN